MTLGSAISSALPFLQSQAESMMLDQCVVTGPDAAPIWDDENEEWIFPGETVIYSGRCQLGKAEPNGQDASTGEAAWAKGLLPLKLPARQLDGDMGDPMAVTDGHIVTVTTKNDLRATVRFTVPQTYEKSRKVACELVSRDAANA